MNQMQQIFAVVELAFVFVLLVLISSLMSYFYSIGTELYKDWKDYIANKRDGDGLMTQVIALLGCCILFSMLGIFMTLSLYQTIGNTLSCLIFVTIAVSFGIGFFLKFQKIRQRRG